MARILPFVFVVLWASAFITSKVIVQDGTPFASLTLRFAIVTASFVIICVALGDSLRVPAREAAKAGASGLLFHAVSLGGVFYAISSGLPAGVAALVMSLQPVLTSALAGPLLGETVRARQWAGMALGFSGVGLVLGEDLGGAVPYEGLWPTGVALLAMTGGTLWQKHLSGRLALPVANLYQAGAAAIGLTVAMMVLEEPSIRPSTAFVLAMGWQVLAISLAAFTILMHLIKLGTASQTAALFFLVPPVSAVMAWAFLGETLTPTDLIGLAIATAGVYVATRRGRTGITY